MRDAPASSGHQVPAARIAGDCLLSIVLRPRHMKRCSFIFEQLYFSADTRNTAGATLIIDESGRVMSEGNARRPVVIVVPFFYSG